MTDDKKRRVFVAIGVSPKLQETIVEWEKNYQKLPVRWLAPKNLHITLIPPWYEENVEGVAKSLSFLEGKPGSFEMEFDKVTYGPDPRRPRLIWAEGKAPEKIVRLKSELEKMLTKEPEQRPFIRLHLTIARFRPEYFVNFPIKTLDEKVFWQDTVTSFVLMESHLSRSGADYEVLTEKKL